MVTMSKFTCCQFHIKGGRYSLAKCKNQHLYYYLQYEIHSLDNCYFGLVCYRLYCSAHASKLCHCRLLLLFYSFQLLLCSFQLVVLWLWHSTAIRHCLLFLHATSSRRQCRCYREWRYPLLHKRHSWWTSLPWGFHQDCSLCKDIWLCSSYWYHWQSCLSTWSQWWWRTIWVSFFCYYLFVSMVTKHHLSSSNMDIKDVTCNGYKYFVNLIEPDANVFCIRCCESQSDCNLGISTYGCERVVPGDYS